MKNLNRWTVLALFVISFAAVAGCLTKTIDPPNQKIFYVPPRPSIEFEDNGDHCLSEQDFRRLANWVIHAEKALDKYERAVMINRGEKND